LFLPVTDPLTGVIADPAANSWEGVFVKKDGQGIIEISL
jgi:hypothetical protein